MVKKKVMLKRKIFINDLTQYKKEIEMSGEIESTGIVRYDPVRTGLKSNASCCVIDVDDGISDYYRHLVSSKYGIKLDKPSWGAHISVIQGRWAKESPDFDKLWGLYEGLEVDFKYSIYPRFSGDVKYKTSTPNGSFWFLDVKCDMFYKIRQELGVDIVIKPHITIARKWL